MANNLAELPIPDYKYITRTEDALKELETLERFDILEVDTECTGLDPLSDRVVLLQIGGMGKAWVFDVRDDNVDAKIFKPLLENNTQLKLLQNARFDYQMLKTNFSISLNRIYDTMLAEQILYLGLNPKASLDFLVRKYLSMDMPKDAATSFQKYNQEYEEYQKRYAANDVAGYLREIYNQQMVLLKKEGLMRVARLEFEFVKPLAEMELRGIILDKNLWTKIIEERVIEKDRVGIQLGDMLEAAEDQTTLFGVSLTNLDSPIQLVKKLNRMGIPVEKTDVKELSKFKKYPIVKLLLEYRGHSKFVGTYGESLLAQIRPDTGRLHTRFRQMVDTGRLSSSEPNLQNIPKEQKYRSCFVAKPGYKLITCDMSGAELRIIADMSKEPKWLRIYNEGLDLHSISAAGIFGVPEAEVTADKKLDDTDPNKKFYRDRSKPLSFGLAYGLTNFGLSTRLGISKDDAQAMIDAYFKTYPGVKRFLDDSAKSAIIKRYSVAASGRKRYYNIPNRDDPEYKTIRGSVERQAKNMPIQAGNADTIKQAIIFMEERLSNYDAEVVLTVHDEVVVEVVEAQAEEVSKIVSQAMVDGFSEFFKTVPMVADASINDFWKK